jgi:cytochrome P450
LTEIIAAYVADSTVRAIIGSRPFKGRDACLKLFEDMFRMMPGLSLPDLFPSSRLAMLVSREPGRIKRCRHAMLEIMDAVIQEHRERKATVGGEDEDLVDVLLRLHADPAQGGTFGSRDQIKGILTDMFIAGTDTSAATVEWTMTELVNHPDVLAKAQHEVRSVVGDGSDMVREPDLQGLEYLKLVIKESMRLHPPVPLLVPRETIEPCTVQGCEVPAGTRVLVNAKAIGAHPGAWGPDAALFVPERHSEVEAGKDFRPWVDDSFALVPFGIGRRSCPGVHFATAVVELVLANLLFSFDWSAPLGEAVDTEEVNGLTVYRKNPLLLLAKRRYVPASK